MTVIPTLSGQLKHGLFSPYKYMLARLRSNVFANLKIIVLDQIIATEFVDMLNREAVVGIEVVCLADTTTVVFGGPIWVQ